MTADKVNYEGTQHVASLMVRIALSFAKVNKTPDYIEMTKPAGSIKRKNLRATLGTIPDYTKSNIIVVTLSGVAKDGPAFAAGLRAGDIIVALAGKKIENIYDYVYSLDALKIGAPVKVISLQGKDRVTSMITPESRE